MKRVATSAVNTLHIKQDKPTIRVNYLNSKQSEANSPHLC